MRILHELNQLEYGGVERVVSNIIKYDKKNEHTVLAYKDGPFRKELEGVDILMPPKEKNKTLDFETDLIHIHTGGDISKLATSVGKGFPVVETIHSPVRSPMRSDFIAQRVGVTKSVSNMNDECVTIYNGLDLEKLQPTKNPDEVKATLGIDKGAIVIGRLGRIGQDKYMEEWLLTCYYLQKMGFDFVPLIVGDEALNCKGYRGKLKLMAASLPVKNIIWAGHKDDVANYYQIMDVFLYPSATEGFGLVYAEAMLSGAVLVSYKNDVTMEVAGGFGILTGKSIEDLVNGVIRALDINVRDAITPLAMNWIKEEFLAEKMAGKYGELYERVARDFKR